MTQQRFVKFSWSLLILSLVLPVVAWGSGLSWNPGSLTLYQWFPLFGLIAWMVMWTHYVSGVFRIRDTRLKSTAAYSRLSAWLVLATLLLHPGLLAYQLWQNGAGLPPDSYSSYVGEPLKLAVIFGTISLIIFLSFEVFNRLKEKSYMQKWWPAVSISQSFAMTFVFIHALRLGTDLVSGWFLWVWIAYGVILLPCFYVIHKSDFSRR